MSIFGNKSVTESSTIPLLESFDMDSYSYMILKDSEYESYKISLEFNQTVYAGLKYDMMEVVNEGFTDFFKKAAEFFRNLAKKVLEFTKNYMKYFLSYFQDFNKFLDKNKEHLRSLKVNFSDKGYEYKFPKESPNISKVHDIVASYNTEIGRVEKMKYSEVSALRDQFADETYKNKVRASILNSGDHEISAEDFYTKSKRLFKSSDEEVSININNSYIDKILREYGELKKLLNETEQCKNKIVKLLNELEFFFTKKASVIYNNAEKKIRVSTIDSSDNKFSYGTNTDVEYDSELIKTLNAYFDLKYRESRFISNCVITVYTDKVNAIKSCMTQYRSIVRKALLNKKDSQNSQDSNKSEVKD